MATPLPADVGPSEPLAVSSARLGHLAWAERRVFEVIGGWIPTTATVPMKLAFGSLAPSAAWRARVWHDRLPELREMDREPLTRPADQRLVEVFEGLERLGGSLDRLGALARVVFPALLAAYDEHEQRSSLVADGPFLRWVGPARASVAADHDEVERLLSDRTATAADAEQVATGTRRLSGALTEAGGWLA
jgi:hypothetical protein